MLGWWSCYYVEWADENKGCWVGYDSKYRNVDDEYQQYELRYAVERATRWTMRKVGVKC